MRKSMVNSKGANCFVKKPKCKQTNLTLILFLIYQKTDPNSYLSLHEYCVRSKHRTDPNWLKKSKYQSPFVNRPPILPLMKPLNFFLNSKDWLTSLSPRLGRNLSLLSGRDVKYSNWSKFAEAWLHLLSNVRLCHSHPPDLKKIKYITVNFIHNQYQVKVSRSRNMKQKIYEILTSPKIQTNGVILNNCIDQVCMFMF